MSTDAIRIAAIIPARMNSSRFPGKPLAHLIDRTMLEHVVRRAELSSLSNQVYVATCDEQIRRVVEDFGGATIMTAASHERATDRVAEAAEQLEAEIIIMIQGDEPMITPEMIDQVVISMLADSSIKLANLAARIDDETEYLDRNTIKVVMNECCHALYFSRAPIPYLDFSETNRAPLFKQVCVMGFRKNFLREFAKMPASALEQAESIDLLRAIEHGQPVRMIETVTKTHAVDTPDDLQLVESLMQNDLLIAQYQMGQWRMSR